jgi:TPR repeat protein
MAATPDQLPAPPAEVNYTASESLVPPLPRAGSADAQRLLNRAEALLRVRDISGARLLLERAGELGSTRGVYLLAQTYDPTMLAHWQVRGITGDPEKAEKLYAQSRMPALREANGIATPR